MALYKQQVLRFEQRKEESRKILEKFPDKVPVICEKHLRSPLPELERGKCLAPMDLTGLQFMSIIRRKIKLPPKESL